MAPSRPKEKRGTASLSPASSSVTLPEVAQLLVPFSDFALKAALEKPSTATAARPRPPAAAPTLAKLRVRRVVVIVLVSPWSRPLTALVSSVRNTLSIGQTAG